MKEGIISVAFANTTADPNAIYVIIGIVILFFIYNGFIRDFSEEGGEEIFLPALSSANKLHSLTNQKLPEISPHCEGTGK